MRRRQVQISVGATSAAGATALVAISTAWQPWLPGGFGAWTDAIVNEWIVWFTALYLVLLVAVAVMERVPSGERITSATWRDHGPDAAGSNSSGI
jgi:hypothetical protein